MQLDTVTFNGTQPTFEKVITTVLTQWGELPHAMGPIRTIGGVTNEREKYLEALRQQRQQAIIAHEVISRSTAGFNYRGDDVGIIFYLYTDEPPIFAQVEYGRLDTQIAPHDRTRVTVAAHENLAAEMRKLWARLKDELIIEGWIDREDVQSTKPIKSDEEQRRIAEIKAMDWKKMSDYQIGQRLYVGESRAKQLRLKGGMKRKERTKTLS